MKQETAWAENGQLEDCVGGDCSVGSGTEAGADPREGLDVSCARENIALKEEVSLALPARAPCSMWLHFCGWSSRPRVPVACRCTA